MRNPIVWLLGSLAVLRIRRPRSRGGPLPDPSNAVPASDTPPETPREWHLNPGRARWARWARRAERLRWSGRSLPLLPEEECWQRGTGGCRRRPVGLTDWEQWETGHPVRTYVIVALGEGAGHG